MTDSFGLLPKMQHEYADDARETYKSATWADWLLTESDDRRDQI